MWVAPAYTARVISYHVYTSASAIGGGRSQIGKDVAFGTDDAPIPPETPFNHHLVVPLDSVNDFGLFAYSLPRIHECLSDIGHRPIINV